MKTKLLSLAGFIAVVSIVFASCTKEGPAGPPGADGNANVRSEMITVLADEWEGGGFFYDAYKPSNVITSSIAEKGAVLCYLKTGDWYTPLPFSYSSGAWTTHIGFEHTVGEIWMFFQDDDGLTPPPGDREFKVVAIAARVLEENPTILDMEYADAMRVLGLER